jgi:hypothetical protein
VGKTDIALAWFGGQCVATLREADRIEGRVVRGLGPARRRESLNASLEARIAAMAVSEMLQWQQKKN